jgi:exonuclease III
MKVISLNCWAGKVYDPLIKFIEREKETDIFCFQEMLFGGPEGPFSHHNIRGRLFESLQKILPEYVAYKSPSERAVTFGLDGYKIENGAKFGQAIFVKKSVEVLEISAFLLYSSDKDPFKDTTIGSVTGKCQYVDLRIQDKVVTFCNIHGLWQWAKNDTPERMRQSEILIDFISARKNPAVLIGDFNINPKTESVAKLGKNFKNLISEYGVQTTRNKLYLDMEKYKDYVSDYAFLTPDIFLNDFKVLKEEVSDHLPLFLDFDLKK